ARLVHVGQHRGALVIQDLGADGHLEHHVLALGPVHLPAHAVAAGLGLEVLLVPVVDQGVQPLDRLDPDVAAAAAVAAVGAAVLDEFLAPERHRTGAAVAGANVDLGLVEELHGDYLASNGGEVEALRRLDRRARPAKALEDRPWILRPTLRPRPTAAGGAPRCAGCAAAVRPAGRNRCSPATSSPGRRATAAARASTATGRTTSRPIWPCSSPATWWSR